MGVMRPETFLFRWVTASLGWAEVDVVLSHHISWNGYFKVDLRDDGWQGRHRFAGSGDVLATISFTYRFFNFNGWRFHLDPFFGPMSFQLRWFKGGRCRRLRFPSVWARSSENPTLTSSCSCVGARLHSQWMLNLVLSRALDSQNWQVKLIKLFC